MFREGHHIGHYTLIEKIGSGGFGEVWLAESRTESIAARVAIKLPHSEEIDWQTITQEIGLWVICGKHPNILPFLEARIYNGQIAIVSEYASEGSLESLLNKQGALPLKQAVKMAIEILDGLAHLHSSGIIHRDLKPANVLLQNSKPRLADFGISRVMTTNSLSQTTAGTPSYMAPEAFDGKRNARTDVWSVSVILYQLLNDSLPFPQKDRTALIGAIVMHEPEPLPDSIPLALKNVVMKALAKDIEKRYQTAAEMRQALYSFLSAYHEPETTTPSAQLIPYRKGSKWGFCDANKRIIIGTKYDNARPFSDDLALVELNDKCSFIDRKGQEISPFKYDNARSFSEGLARVLLNGWWGFIDRSGLEVTPFVYDADDFSNGLATVKIDGKWGFIDHTGQEAIFCVYDDAQSFSEGLAWIALNGKWSFIDDEGQEAIPFKYDAARSFSEGLAWVELNGKGGFIDRNGREIIPIKYDEGGDFSEGLAWVELNHRRGFIDSSGRLSVPLKYEAWGYTFSPNGFSEGLACVELDGKCGFINRAGREVIPFKYDNAKSFSEGLACVEQKGKWGFVDCMGQEIIPFKYDNAETFKCGIARVEFNHKYEQGAGGCGTRFLVSAEHGYVGQDGTEYFER